MACFHPNAFHKYDDYATPKSAWEAIQHLIPRDKTLWEAFFCDGSSGTHLQELGFNVIHENIDFFEHNRGDIVISNPPFSKLKAILQRLIHDLDKPFILIIPVSKLNTRYMRDIIQGQEQKLQIIIPRERIQFIKMTTDGQVLENKGRCNFDCIYCCYKMNFPHSIMWLDR